MLSCLLKSKWAVQVNVQIMRTFAHQWQLLAPREALACDLKELEFKCACQFKVVFDVIKQLMTAPEPEPKRRIGFHSDND